MRRRTKAEKSNGKKYRCVGGLLEVMTGEAVDRARRAAGEAAGGDVPGCKKELARAIEENLMNRRENGFERLQRKYGLPMDHNAFGRRKLAYADEFLRVLGEILCQMGGGNGV